MKFLKVSIFVLLLGCSVQPSNKKLFSNITKSSGVDFSNNLTYTEKLNPYTYRNFYNGAGVAIGDINNDGLSDIYFAGNQVDNKLYLNKGGFVFQDITKNAGVACSDVWSTGVTMVDINADGYLDIYVCKSGDPNTPNRHNELFINNGDLTFTEKSKEYGLDVKGLSVHAAFFDYDKDGDLDCYLLTNSIRSVGNYDLIKNQREIADPMGGGNKFFINEDGKFKDFTQQAGIYRSNIGFGLGITLGDFNNDSWLDIFISNDFFERDYLYINNKKGGFDESLTKYFKSISMGSMGADVADLDNDGRVELIVTEMLPDSLSRKKTKTVYENWDKYQMNLKNGYYHQFPRNVLQKNIGDSTYVEVGRLSGVSATEWSWGALLFDMDNDGKRDIFIANGIYKDLLDRDYLNYTATDKNIKQMIKNKEDVITKLVDKMPSSEVPNYAFKNNGDLKFEMVSEEWGLDKPMYSNGSAYGDLDNDGDLDLVVNNVNMPSVVYQNNTDTADNRSLNLLLQTNGKNTFAVGAKVTAYVGKQIFHTDNFVTRGFQSSVDPRVHIGLGTHNKIDSLIIEWPEGGITKLDNQPVNKLIILQKDDQKIEFPAKKKNEGSNFRLHKMKSDALFTHQGSHLVDFNRSRLLPMMYSNETPGTTKGDVDNDGVDEVYIGGGKNQAGCFIKKMNGGFTSYTPTGLKEHKLPEETKSVLFDADGDGDLDLYTASGGRFYPKTSSVLMDKLFINDGKGNYAESEHALPFNKFISTSTAVPIDFDNDGDLDLFIGERFHPFYYGIGGSAYLLSNDGNGVFKDVTDQYASLLTTIGMVTGAVAVDFDGDDWDDLVVIGDWMPIKFLKNNNGKFTDVSSTFNLENTEGWWHEIKAADFNKDGRMDFVLGNHGSNTFFKTKDRMYINDFDKNGSIEQIFCTQINDKYYPIIDRDELLSQLPLLKKKLVYYEGYANKTINQLFDKEVISNSKIHEVNMLNSVMLLSNSSGYSLKQLPLEAQYAPIYSLLIDDFNDDGILDLIAGGNHYEVKPQFGRYDASYGWYFEGHVDNDKFSLEKGLKLNIDGEIRGLEELKVDKRRFLIVAKHNDSAEIYEISN